jgi:Gpi18-like mannosyltransferase
VLAFVTRDVLAAAFVLSGLASIATGLLLKRLVRLDEPEAIARSAVWFLFVYPTSFFLHIPYTESLFLALVLGCFVAARTEHWHVAGILGAFACLTRVNGLLLAPALAVEALSQLRAHRRLHWSWLWIALVPTGFLAYLALNYYVTGDFFAFATIQQEHWFKKFTPPWVGMREIWLRALGENPIEGLHEFFFVVLSLLCTIWSWIWLRPSYATWMTCNWLLINSTNFILSVPRYTLPMFPIFILAARASRGRRVFFAGVSIWSLLYLSFYAGRFVRGLWAF